MENISKYLENEKFIKWVFQPNENLEKWWNDFETEHPHEKHNLSQARKVLNNLKTKDKSLSQEEKITIFAGILKQIERKQEHRKSRKIYVSILKYAAVAILFFSIGALLFYERESFNTEFYSYQINKPLSGNGAQLIRPNGESIVLNERKSVIDHSQNGKVVVNDNVVANSGAANNDSPQMNQLAIPYGKTSEILLSDGTKVYLNAGSRLIYPEFFKDKTREVFLAGEAFFEVVHNESNPFIVQTTDIRVKVLGTQFNISSYPSDNVIETVLTEGKVELLPNNSSLFSEAITLSPDDLAAYDKSSKKTFLKKVDTDDYTLWKDGLFKFKSTDLSRIVKKLERYYNIRFEYKDPLAGTIKISGKLELANNREEVINRMAIAADVSIVKKGENYYVIN